MKKYVRHLLEDIRNSHRPEDFFEKKESSIISGEDELDGHFAEVDRYLNIDSEPTFSSYCGLKKEMFPASEYYDQVELQKVNFEFQQMMRSWNLEIDLPNNFPEARAYELMLDILDRSVLVGKYGLQHFDFCTGNPEGCELGEYCPCIEYWKETK